MLTPQILIKMGITGKTIGRLIKASQDWTHTQTIHFIKTGETPKSEKDYTVKPGTILSWLIHNSCVKDMLSREGSCSGIASNAEKRRWLEKGSVLINGEVVGPDDLLPDEICCIVFFPNGRRITMPGNKTLCEH